MENIDLVKKNTRSGLYQKIVLKLLGNFKRGKLNMILPDGSSMVFGGDLPGIEANVHVHHKDFFKKCVFSGDIGFGESYCDGDWTSPNLTHVIRFLIQNIDYVGMMSGSKVSNLMMNFLGKINRMTHLFNRNTLEGSRKNISFHYDLSNEFYQLMLDKTMSYSSAVFTNEHQSLQAAQEHKLQLLCDDLDLRDDDHVLEIGCGWGSFVLYAAQRYQAKFTCITISQEQYDHLTKRIKKEKLDGRVEVLLKDYRDLEGTYSKIVSVEMIEAVGDEYLPEYFQSIHRLMAKNGVAVIQAITSPDSRYESFKNGVDFIQKHIFPGTLLPSVNAMVSACQKKTDLQLFNLRDIGLHYAKTLNMWEEQINENLQQVKDLGFDQAFLRKWKYYLNYCEAAFQERNISDVQITLIRPNNTVYKY